MRNTAIFVAGILAVSAGLSAQTAATAAARGPWNFTTNYAFRETVDGNVFLQDIGDMALRRSLVTSAMLGIGVGYQRNSAFRAAFTYAPELARYHSYSSENHVVHRAAANFAGSSGRTVWEFTNALVRIDGSDQGPIFDVVNHCDIPALGGIPLRERRDALVLRNGFRLTHTMGRWFLRPSFTSYVHDFRTQQRPRTGVYTGYENYVDRWEMNGGLDAGYGLGERTWLVVGHRYGHQQQGRLLGVESPYSNSYNRVLAGVEGTPTGWLRLNLLAGPDIRRFERRAAGFHAEEMLWFINASASWVPNKIDTLTVTLSRFQQPAFSSQSVYEDIVYDLAWRRQHGRRLSSAVGLRFYGGDWQAPVNREDWITTPSASLAYTINRHLNFEAAYSHDAVESRVPNTRGREFTRHLFTVGVRGAF